MGLPASGRGTGTIIELLHGVRWWSEQTAGTWCENTILLLPGDNFKELILIFQVTGRTKDTSVLNI